MQPEVWLIVSPEHCPAGSARADGLATKFGPFTPASADVFRAEHGLTTGRAAVVRLWNVGGAAVPVTPGAPAVMKVALADGMLRNESMELNLRALKTETAGLSKKPAERAMFRSEVLALRRASADKAEKGQ